MFKKEQESIILKLYKKEQKDHSQIQSQSQNDTNI